MEDDSNTGNVTASTAEPKDKSAEVPELDVSFKQPLLPTLPPKKASHCEDNSLEEKSANSQTQTKKETTSNSNNKEILKLVPPLPYTEPSWSGICSQKYTLEIIKNGVPVDDIPLSSKPFWVIGRLPQCDMSMEHPSLSRYHAVIQFCSIPTDKHAVGWYLYDLGSTHGSTLNKAKVSPDVYHRLRVGYTFKFGGSSRLHILQGPDEDQENEVSPEDLTALREKRKAQLEERLRLKAEAKNSSVSNNEGNGDGCSWGMDADAEENDPNAVNPFSSDVITGELHLDDPKKTLRGWYEREGYDEPEYILEEQCHGRYRCTVELPVDTPTGHALKAEVSVEGKKKEAVVQCAMEACRILDRQGVLRQAKHESRKRKAKNWDDNDFYDSDDDTFLDRTGDVEKKRQLRMKRAGKLEEEKKQSALTYDQLVTQLIGVETEMADIQAKLDRTKKLEKERDADMDDLDAYMLSIKSGGMNATEKTKCRRRMIELKQDKARTEKLVNIAKPNSLVEIREVIKNKISPAASRELSSPVTENTNKDKTTDPSTETLKPVIPDTADIATDQIELTPDSSQVSAKSDEIKSITLEEINCPASAGSTESSDTKPSQYTAQLKVSSKKAKRRDKLKERSGEAPARSGKVSDRHAQAPATSSLAGMVTELKTKEEEKQLINDPDFAGWLPPKDQLGDGRTTLNDKFGY